MPAFFSENLCSDPSSIFKISYHGNPLFFIELRTGRQAAYLLVLSQSLLLGLGLRIRRGII